MAKSRLLEAASAVPVTEEVTVVGEKVLVREMDAGTFSRYARSAGSDRAKANAVIIEACVVDADGNKVFSPEEALAIAKKVRLSLKIVSTALNISGVTEDSDEKQPDASTEV